MGEGFFGAPSGKTLWVRTWADRIPLDDNAGWDVDLLRAAPGSQMRHILKMGPLGTQSEACLVQESQWVSATPPP